MVYYILVSSAKRQARGNWQRAPICYIFLNSGQNLLRKGQNQYNIIESGGLCSI